MNYKEFLQAFDEIDNEPRIKPADYIPPGQRLGRFQQENPRAYKRFADRMKAEASGRYYNENTPEDNRNTGEIMLASIRAYCD